ncbi:adenylyl-sulfate kinase [Stutzerimonas stutzeri]|uniref:adenylyl-sulfate kinase n=1 Tax=Stutzerimonas stutzeri TaxID=316 RepID=UPI00210EECAC|nr:adenylyl-sulfate kinase [Stutzerimonas stutzeri]MCQ4226134.1 adenylyl-sulfate kinase [Stutzerimonas stutzeri]
MKSLPPKTNLRIISYGSPGVGKRALIKSLLTGATNLLELAIAASQLTRQREEPLCLISWEEEQLLIADMPAYRQPSQRLGVIMATADFALLLVDALDGMQPQALRDIRIAAMLGVRRVILAVNKMDLVAYEQRRFESIEKEFRAFAQSLGLAEVQAIPLCALHGDNVRERSSHMPWYAGPSLLQALEAAPSQAPAADAPMRLPVEQVLQAEREPTILCGRLAAGTLCPGDAVRVLPSGQQTRIETLQIDGQVRAQAGNGETVSLTLADPLPVARGDVLAAAEALPEVADQFKARLLWLGEQPMTPGRQYLLKLASQDVTATVTHIKNREDSSGARLAAKTLERDSVATVNLSTATPLVFEPHAVNRTLGSFVMCDRQDGETVGVGTIDFALRRASNIHWQALEIDKTARANLKGQTPRCLWFTGLSGSGKSTIANLLEKRLHAEGRHTYVLDGDNVRHGLNRDLGFTEADRVENIRRVAEVAKLMTDAGLLVLVSFISPFVSDRKMARELFAAGEFIEVFVDTPLDECERRDVKGLYAKARRGELKNFTGIDSAYEPSIAPEVHLFPARSSPQDCVDTLLRMLD